MKTLARGPIRITKPLAKLPSDEAETVAKALFALRRVVAERARRGDRHWAPLELLGTGQRIAIRARPGPFGLLTEALLWGKAPRPTRDDAEALAELLGLRYYVVDWLFFTWYVKEASYAAGSKPGVAPATA